MRGFNRGGRGRNKGLLIGDVRVVLGGVLKGCVDRVR